MNSPHKRITVGTPTRLHFGLLATQRPRGRSFGGVGLMIQSPSVEVLVETLALAGDRVVARPEIPSSVVRRAEKIVARMTEAFRLRAEEIPRVTIKSCPTEHVGLGTGTQLSVAIAWGMALAIQRSHSLEWLAQAAGRGKRSGVGIHGFAHGGLVVDPQNWIM